MGLHDRAVRSTRLSRAIHWIGLRLQEEPGANPGELVERASLVFKLTPLQRKFLYHLYRKAA